MWCWEADESVVVIKSQPMKAGNSLEGKTEMTLCSIIVTPSSREETKVMRRDEGKPKKAKLDKTYRYEDNRS